MRLDSVSLASGAVIAALGAIVLLDSADAVDITAGWMAVVLTAALGVVLLVSGLAGRHGGRHD
jgi:ABC-type transporter Mla maintaining outer membrane lipid asymmetry permease subunit MlaE